MTKRILTLVFTAALALGCLTACEDKDSSKSQSQADSSQTESKSAESQIKDVLSGDESLPEGLTLDDNTSYCKEIYSYAAEFCAEKQTAGESVDFTIWEFRPSRPDKEEEFEVYIADKLGGKVQAGYISCKFESGMIKSVSLKDKQDKVIAAYPQE
ncbi:MAG: hypothetical protein K6F91_00090 [Ruminococcus sp.]|nr:hypothetical protein [Ruminococcus sp.]